MPVQVKHTILGPQHWEPVLQAEGLEDPSFTPRGSEKKAYGRRLTSWFNDGRLSPADVYVYLKARFGAPNGALMITRSNDSDNVIHWHFTVRAGDERLNILGISSRLELISSVGPHWQGMGCTYRCYQTRFWSGRKQHGHCEAKS